MNDEAVGPGHPCVRAWLREHPDEPFGQTSSDSAVQQLVADLGLGEIERDLSGDDNLTLLVDRGQHVLRSYKPFVSRERIRDLQRLRSAVAEAGLSTAVPILIGGDSIHPCGNRWAEIEPYLPLPAPNGQHTTTTTLLTGIGRLHRVLARLPPPDSSELRRSFLSVDVLREWVQHNVVDHLLSGEHAGEIQYLLDTIEERWIQPDLLPTQLVHTDPHAGNILHADSESDAFIYLDFAGVEVAPRVHDLAIALMYQFAPLCAVEDRDEHELPGSLDAYNQASRAPLTRAELDALPVYAAAAAAYYDICGWAPPSWQSAGSRLLSIAT